MFLSFLPAPANDECTQAALAIAVDRTSAALQELASSVRLAAALPNDRGAMTAVINQLAFVIKCNNLCGELTINPNLPTNHPASNTER